MRLENEIGFPLRFPIQNSQGNCLVEQIRSGYECWDLFLSAHGLVKRDAIRYSQEDLIYKTCGKKKSILQYQGLSKREYTLRVFLFCLLVPNRRMKQLFHSYLPLERCCSSWNCLYSDVFFIFLLSYSVKQKKISTATNTYPNNWARVATSSFHSISINHFVRRSWKNRLLDVYALQCYSIDECESGQKSWDQHREIGSSSVDHWRGKEPSGSQHGLCMKTNVLTQTDRRSSRMT